MGEKIVAGAFAPSDRQAYREKLTRCLTGLRGSCRSGGSIGPEISWVSRSS